MSENDKQSGKTDDKDWLEAKKLAEKEGLNWKDLPKERRKEFKKQVRGRDQAGKRA
jgi:hypothetical protein